MNEKDKRQLLLDAIEENERKRFRRNCIEVVLYVAMVIVAAAVTAYGIGGRV